LDYVEEILAKLDKADRALASISGSLQFLDTIFKDSFNKEGDKHTEILDESANIGNKKALNQIKRITDKIVHTTWDTFGYESSRGKSIRAMCYNLIAKIDRRVGKIHWNKCSAKIIKCEEPSWNHKYYWKYDKRSKNENRKIEFVYCYYLKRYIGDMWEMGSWCNRCDKWKLSKEQVNMEVVVNEL